MKMKLSIMFVRTLLRTMLLLTADKPAMETSYPHHRNVVYNTQLSGMSLPCPAPPQRWNRLLWTDTPVKMPSSAGHGANTHVMAEMWERDRCVSGVYAKLTLNAVLLLSSVCAAASLLITFR